MTNMILNKRKLDHYPIIDKVLLPVHLMNISCRRKREEDGGEGSTCDGSMEFFVKTVVTYNLSILVATGNLLRIGKDFYWMR